ncbi:MAG TPA: flagellar biosynthetic protein FliO [Gemmataceae bacterium]|nr:flagellar biosynthetic protein FliO [Gemmataceae bacterium]
MVPSDKGAPRKGGLPSWLVLGLLGLMATAGGIFLPRSLRHGEEPSVLMPAATPTADAKEPLDYSPPSMPDLPSPRAMFLRLGLGTIFVLILCVITLWVGKRWIRPLAGSQGENKQLRLLESLSLGGRCSVYLLQAGDTKVLAGVDHAGLKSLLTLPQSFDGALAELNGGTGADSADAA